MKQETMKSLKKSLDILNLFLNQNHEMSLGEISKSAKLTQSTTSRIVAVLVQYNYLKHRGTRGKYSIGPIYLSFCQILKNKTEIRTTAIPHLIKLSQQVKEPSVLALESGIQGIFVEPIRDSSLPDNVLTVSPTGGIRIVPLHCTSVGKIILANMSAVAIEKYFNKRKLQRYTPNTITDIKELKNHLISIRENNIAFDNEEFSIGVRGVAAGLRDDEGKVIGAIGITAPTVRLTPTGIRKLVPLIKSYADEISKELGFEG